MKFPSIQGLGYQCLQAEQPQVTANRLEEVQRFDFWKEEICGGLIGDDSGILIQELLY